MNDEFENALTWFCAAPAGWIESGQKNLAAGAEWIWEVLQGDFNDNASTAQIATGTVISMIPFVDQLCDVRDVVANCRKIKEEPDQKWNWIALVLTLIGLFPSLGSLVKGCLKVAFSAIRKGGAVSGLTPRMALRIDEAILQLNKFLARPEVAKTLTMLHWDNPFKTLAAQLRKLSAKLNVGALQSAFNDAMKALEGLLGIVKRWGNEGLAKKAGDLLETIGQVRRSADRMLGETIKPVQDIIDQLARRLEVETDMAHRAYLHTVNPHAFAKVTEAEEIAAFKKEKPGWVEVTGVPTYEKLASPPGAIPGWPNVRSYNTFHTMRPVTIPPGTKLYRIVDPKSLDNSICWMSEAEFRKLKSKDEWRRRFAVWANWNSNGEFVTYTVPPGPGLNVWEGVAASQQLHGTNYVLAGGGRQIVVEPATIDKSNLSPRKKTGWGHDDLGTKNNFVGVPVQRNNYEKK